MSSILIQKDGSGIWLPHARLENSNDKTETAPRLLLQHPINVLLNDSVSSKPSFREFNVSNWRVVEIRYHPFGDNGVIVVLEHVFSSVWNQTKRFVATNSIALLNYITSSNDITSPMLSPSKRIRYDPRLRLGTNRSICLDLLDQKVRYTVIYIYFPMG
jgi:hypothetical protein